MDGFEMAKRSVRLVEKDLEKFKPLNDWVLVKKYKQGEKTESGIVLLEDRKDYQSKRGTVIKIGSCSDPKAIKPNFTVGDEVIYSAFSGLEFPMPVGYLIMRMQDILAVLEKWNLLNKL